MCKQMVVVQEGTAEKFQESLNSKLRELEHQDPMVEFNHAQGFCSFSGYWPKLDDYMVLIFYIPPNRKEDRLHETETRRCIQGSTTLD